MVIILADFAKELRKDLKMKKLTAIFMSAVMCFLFAGCSNETAQSSDGQASTDSVSSAAVEIPKPDGFKVDGTKLIDGYGEEFVMRGVNHAYTWFKSDTDTALEGIEYVGSNTVRLVLSDGDQWDKVSRAELKSLIRKCKKKNLIAVLEIHDGAGKDEVSYLEHAVDYWIEMKDLLGENKAYTIVNIANEWYGTYNDLETWRDAYINAVKKLRDAGIENTLIVDSAGWGQCADSVLKYGNEILKADKDSNTMFAVHMYGTAGKNEETVKNTIDTAIKNNICLLIGEFGWKHSDGNVAYDTIMQYSTEKNIGYLAWSWKGNGDDVSYLDISRDWAGVDLTTEWGKPLVEGEYGIKKTSKTCSVYTKYASDDTSSDDETAE